MPRVALEISARGNAKRELHDAASAVRGLDAAGKQAAGGLHASATALDELSRKADRMKDLSGKLALGAAGGAAIAGSFIAAAAKMESMEVALAGVSGGAEGATRRLETLRELAKSPAFTLETAVQGDVRLQQVGRSAAQSERDMRGLAAAITATGGSSAELEGAITALTQIQLKGRVSMEELMQLSERGVPAIQVLKDQFHLTAAEMNNLGAAFESRGVSIEQVLDTLSGALLKKFGPAAAAAGGTAQNAFTNFADATFRARAALGEALLPTATKVIGALTALAEGVEKWNPLLKTATGLAVVGGTATLALGAAYLWTRAQLAQLTIARTLATGAAVRHTAATRAETGAVMGLGTASGLASRALGVLKGALSFLLLNPYVLAITAIVAGLTAFALGMRKLKKDTEDARKELDAFAQNAIAIGAIKPEWAGVVSNIGAPVPRAAFTGRRSAVRTAPESARGEGGGGGIDLGNTVAEIEANLRKMGVVNPAPAARPAPGRAARFTPTPAPTPAPVTAEQNFFAAPVLPEAEDPRQTAAKWTSAYRDYVGFLQSTEAPVATITAALQDQATALAREAQMAQAAGDGFAAYSLQLDAARTRHEALKTAQAEQQRQQEAQQETQKKQQESLAQVLAAKEKVITAAAAKGAKVAEEKREKEKELRDRDRDRRRQLLEQQQQEKTGDRRSIGQQVLGLGGADVGDLLAQGRRASGVRAHAANEFERQAQRFGNQLEGELTKGFKALLEQANEALGHSLKRASAGGSRYRV